MENPNSNEMVSLNIDSLDVEELEHRLELAAGGAIGPYAWVCGVDVSLCGVDDVCGVDDNCGANESCVRLSEV
jgi:hypothetical protein